MAAAAAGSGGAAAGGAAAATQLATFAGGCFWCVEAPYLELKGVQSVRSGYIGGQTKAPTYREVCEGTTGHAEAVRVTFEPGSVPFERLLDVFFTLHDPTTLNRQGNDRGTQYRSAIFYHSPEQLATAKAKIARLEASGELGGAKVVTQLEPAERHTWYEAEEYHQDYVRRNPEQGYVQAVSIPKLCKVQKKWVSPAALGLGAFARRIIASPARRAPFASRPGFPRCCAPTRTSYRTTSRAAAETASAASCSGGGGRSLIAARSYHFA